MLCDLPILELRSRPPVCDMRPILVGSKWQKASTFNLFRQGTALKDTQADILVVPAQLKIKLGLVNKILIALGQVVKNVLSTFKKQASKSVCSTDCFSIGWQIRSNLHYSYLRILPKVLQLQVSAEEQAANNCNGIRNCRFKLGSLMKMIL